MVLLRVMLSLAVRRTASILSRLIIPAARVKLWPSITVEMGLITASPTTLTAPSALVFR